MGFDRRLFLYLLLPPVLQAGKRNKFRIVTAHGTQKEQDELSPEQLNQKELKYPYDASSQFGYGLAILLNHYESTNSNKAESLRKGYTLASDDYSIVVEGRLDVQPTEDRLTLDVSRSYLRIHPLKSENPLDLYPPKLRQAAEAYNDCTLTDIGFNGAVNYAHPNGTKGTIQPINFSNWELRKTIDISQVMQRREQLALNALRTMLGEHIAKSYLK